MLRACLYTGDINIQPVYSADYFWGDCQETLHSWSKKAKLKYGPLEYRVTVVHHHEPRVLYGPLSVSLAHLIRLSHHILNFS